MARGNTGDSEAEWVTDEPQTDPKQVLGGKTLWVVDDMRANRLVVEQMAARYGAKVRSFESALQHAFYRPPN